VLLNGRKAASKQTNYWGRKAYNAELHSLCFSAYVNIRAMKLRSVEELNM
jgi:hypothetical protein